MSDLEKKLHDYFKENEKRDRKVNVLNAVKKFKVAEKTANIYYSNWKKAYMGTEDCIPGETKKQIDSQEIKAGLIKQSNSEKILINDNFNKIEKKNNDLDIIELVIKGKYATYKKTKEGVDILGGLSFKNTQEIEQYRKDAVNEIYSRLSEILDVISLEV